MKKRRWLLFFIFWLMLLGTVNQYFFCPQYLFIPPSPFQGSNIYNPYEGEEFTDWKKCNFHAHVRAWMGLTYGTSTSAIAMATYDSLGYHVRCISNYQRIDTYGSEQTNYLATYEHGYGILKHHQTILGASKVVWKDYIWPQTLSNKQHILKKLRNTDSSHIIINHPANRNSYRADNFKWLRGYDYIEIFPSGSFAAFDSALSAGRPVYSVANDDAHDITNPLDVGRYCTWVGARTADKSSILQALKAGRSYIMVINNKPGQSFEDKQKRVKAGLQTLKHVQVRNDTLFVAINDTGAIAFYGQGGKMISASNDCVAAFYIIKQEDTYVRARIFYRDGNEINLNPVFRYDQSLPADILPSVNETKTLLFRLAGTFILIAIPLLFYFFPGGRKLS